MSKSDSSSGYHLLLLKSFLEGKYEEALRIYDKIDSEYAKLGELDKTVLNAYLHIGSYAEAEQFALARNMEEHEVSRLIQLKEHPLKVILDTLSVIPFTEGPLSEFFHGFEAELN